MIFRIKFAKYGVVRFIGHLDVMRYFQKVIRRSELPVSYSQGFSPHQLMSFALPLGVGITSDGEYMEVEFEDEGMRKLAAERNTDDFEGLISAELESNTTEGFEILRVMRLPDPKPNVHQDKAMALVSAADYLIRVKDGYDIGFSSQEEFYAAFCGFMSRDSIEVTKRTKKSEKVINIREYIYEFGNGSCDAGTENGNDISEDTKGSTISRDGSTVISAIAADQAGNPVITGTEHAAEYDNGLQITVRLAAGSMMNIKPELVLEAFMESIGREYNENAFAQHRMELLTGDAGNFRPLI